MCIRDSLFAVWLVVSALLAFFIGGINPARLVARALGVDLAAEGSGNPGATNACLLYTSRCV